MDRYRLLRLLVIDARPLFSGYIDHYRKNCLQKMFFVVLHIGVIVRLALNEVETIEVACLRGD